MGFGLAGNDHAQRAAVARLGLLLICCAVPAMATQQPSVLLYGATLDAGRQFAVDSALIRGWRVLSVNPDEVIFEQTLEEAEDDLSLEPLRVIRIFATFAEESAGLRIYLRAEEIEYPGADREWMSDMTGRYADNLDHALSSLRARWDEAFHSGAVQPPSMTVQKAAPYPDLSSSRNAIARVGIWAYYAERYAQSRGCDLTDSGAELEAAGQEWEQHLVSCQDGRRMRIHCRYGDCTSSPPMR